MREMSGLDRGGTVPSQGKHLYSNYFTEAVVKQLLNKGTTAKKVKGLKSKKTGKTFEAYLDVDKETGNLKPRF